MNMNCNCLPICDYWLSALNCLPAIPVSKNKVLLSLGKLYCPKLHLFSVKTQVEYYLIIVPRVNVNKCYVSSTFFCIAIKRYNMSS